MQSRKIKVAVVGGTGYTGVELIRLLLTHPQFDLQVVTSRSDAGKPIGSAFPNFVKRNDLLFSEPSIDNLAQCELVFFATPNGTAMQMTPELLSAGVKVIDLAADFRLRDATEWERWYQQPHACKDLLSQAVYGLPERYRNEIRAASLVANPGCYPTAVILALLPLLENDCIDPKNIIADAKSGISGAGRGANVAMLHAEASESFKAYGIAGHRHLPEIEQQLVLASSGNSVGLTFVPHLLPMNRGIEATLYLRNRAGEKDIRQLFLERYDQEPYVCVLDAGQHPETRAVRGSNYCHLSVFELSDERIVVSSVIDNLVKGAAGQAIQNANLMFGLNETDGLKMYGLLP